MAEDYRIDFYVIPDVTWDQTMEAAKRFCSVRYLGKQSQFNLPGPFVKSMQSRGPKPKDMRQQPFGYDGLYLLRRENEKPSYEDYMEKAEQFMLLRGLRLSKAQLSKDYQELMEKPDFLDLLLYQTNGRKCSWMAAIDAYSVADIGMLLSAICTDLGLGPVGYTDESKIAYSMAWHYDNSTFKGDFDQYMEQAKESGLVGDEELDELYFGDAAEKFKSQYEQIDQFLSGDFDDDDDYGDDFNDDWEDIEESRITPSDIARLITEDPDISEEDDLKK